MFFATFQSKSFTDCIIRGEKPHCIEKGRVRSGLQNVLGYDPIFCISLEGDYREVLAKFLMTCCECPQKLILFKSDEFDTVSFASLSRYLINNGELRVNPKYGYVEHLVSEIKPENVVKVIDICASDDDDVMQDALLDFNTSSSLPLALSNVDHGFSDYQIKSLFSLPAVVSLKYCDYLKLLLVANYVSSEVELREFSEFLQSNLVFKTNKKQNFRNPMSLF